MTLHSNSAFGHPAPHCLSPHTQNCGLGFLSDRADQPVAPAVVLSPQNPAPAGAPIHRT